MAVAKGRIGEPGSARAGDLVIFEPSETKIDITAETDAEFVIGSALPATHELALGTYSVHTSAESLANGERHIVEIGQRLRAQRLLLSPPFRASQDGARRVRHRVVQPPCRRGVSRQ